MVRNSCGIGARVRKWRSCLKICWYFERLLNVCVCEFLSRTPGVTNCPWHFQYGGVACS